MTYTYCIGYRWFDSCRELSRSLRVNDIFKVSNRPQKVRNFIDTDEWTFKSCRVIIESKRPNDVRDIIRRFL